jgi:hypothetical protein
MLAKFLNGSSTPVASAALLPPQLLRLLPAGVKVAGWDSHPLKKQRLLTAHAKFVLNPLWTSSMISIPGLKLSEKWCAYRIIIAVVFHLPNF